MDVNDNLGDVEDLKPCIQDFTGCIPHDVLHGTDCIRDQFPADVHCVLHRECRISHPAARIQGHAF
jgi:hypothetical protein